MDGLRRAGLILAAAGLVACGGTAAPVNVEGTVQARVSATVGAAARAQLTPTRPPPGTTVIPLGTVGATGAAGTSSVSSGGGTAAAALPAATASAAAALTATRGAGTPLASVAVTSSVTAGTATVLSSSAATPPPPLVLGAFARLGSFSATVMRYEWSTACPSGTGRAAAGTKFVVLQGVGRNEGSGALTPPPVIWAVESTPSGASLPCRPEGRSFDEACYRNGALPAGSRCEGWLLFEVPERLDVPGALVTARVAGPLATPGPGTADVGRWRLPP